MIGGIFLFLGAVLKVLPLVFLFMAGRDHARSRSMAAKARAKTDQADIAARAHHHPSDILDRMRKRGLRGRQLSNMARGQTISGIGGGAGHDAR